jgi:hypothetical protein
MVELPEDPNVVLIVIHDGGRFVSVPVHRSNLLEGDVTFAISQIIERAERDLQSAHSLYRGRTP